MEVEPTDVAISLLNVVLTGPAIFGSAVFGRDTRRCGGGVRLGRACGQPPSVGLSIGEVGGAAGAAILPPALRNQVRRGRSRVRPCEPRGFGWRAHRPGRLSVVQVGPPLGRLSYRLEGETS